MSVGTASGLWTSMGTGNFLPSPTLLNTSYIYSANDLTVGTVTLVLTSINNGVCPAVSDSVVLTIFKDPIIDLKSDTTVCSYQNPLNITAGLSGSFGGILWTTSGTGTFIPNSFTNPIKYKFGPSELNSGVLTLTVSLLNNGPCANKSSIINVTIRPTPIAAFVASSYTINSTKDPIAFTNNSQQASIYSWDFGDGNFSTQTSPSHVYASAGFYNVVLIASNQYSCTDTARRTNYG
ncbi:MAG: PKD domain-containing protein [Sphingobacteriaceae bacterium]|nr:PKD domain-containing protein [Sphingobacteriaceae bacterium]